MYNKLKKFFYFPIAYYFRFFALIRLSIWNPQIIVVTGSNGKTTTLNLIESQLGIKAKYSHKANSSYGIPFDILGIKRLTFLKSEWFEIFLKAPFQIFKSLPKEKLYVVEADCDRPGEGKFLGTVLKPSIVIWLSSANTHSINFEHLVTKREFKSTTDSIAYEFGFFIEYAKEKVIINGDSYIINSQIKRSNAEIISIKKEKNALKYDVGIRGTEFHYGGKNYFFNYILPEEVIYSILATQKLCELLNISFDQSFADFKMPPGRGSIFKGIRNTTIVDSSYNLSSESVRAIINTYNKMNSNNKWLVLGDIIDLGELEKKEHEEFARIISNCKFEKIILLGPRVSSFTYPKLKHENIVKLQKPREALDYILQNIVGGETILFKGARFMEGIIEHLLRDREDIKKLARREKVWEIRRRKWGL